MAFVDESLWSRLSPLLDQALELDGEPRDQLVRALRERDPALAAALERHLAEHERALSSGFLGLPAASAPVSLEGRTFGAYELVERLGAGGMGTVWRARRNDGRFEGDVAVKLLHPSLLEERGTERFRSEGSILSRLTHAGIARLYDAGVSPAGQPFLVLELVDGLRIDRFADTHRLPVRARLELFLQIADAVVYAHSNLVVHRDLKPSNILVDRAGRTKLLDFGIASLVDQASGVAVGGTVTSARALTPEYAAPEQLEGGAITTATDVYALGVLLYELLTGEHPVVRADTSPAELVRAITTGETPRMSERIRRSAANLDYEVSRFEARGTTPERLARALAGDLDTIVAKALKRPVAERYPTVAALAEDLRRHLQDLPVRARPDSLGYRVRKLVARHRVEVGAASLVVAALLSATAISWRQARASAAERDRAVAELKRAEITNDFSNFLLSEAPTEGAANGKSELLKRGETMIARRFAGDPALQAHLLLLLADLYDERLQSASSSRVTERAFALAASAGDSRLRALAACHMSLVALRAGDSERANTLIAGALADLAREPGSEREEARCRMYEGYIAYQGRDYERSIRADERALELERRRQGPPGRGLDLLIELGRAYAAVGRGADSDRTFGEYFVELEAQGRERSQPAFVANTNWAVALQRSGQVLRAVERWERAVAIARDLDPAHGASSFELVGLAVLLPSVGRPDDGIAAITEALAKVRAENAPGVLFEVLVRAARIHAEAPGYETAKRFLTEAAELVRRNPEPAPDLRLADLDRVRSILASNERDAIGTAALATAAELARAAHGAYETAGRSPRELMTLSLLLARKENDGRNFDAALAAGQSALATAAKLGGDHPHSADVGTAELELARAHLGRGELAAARRAVHAAATHLEATAGPAAPDFRRAIALRNEIGG